MMSNTSPNFKALLSPYSPLSPPSCINLWRYLSLTLAPKQRKALVLFSVDISQLCSLVPYSETCVAVKNTFIFSELIISVN